MTATATAAVNMTGGAKTLRRLEYHPKTFVQRGAVAPFTTRLLSQGRIRPGSKQNNAEAIEALLPGFSGGASVYVTPLATVDELVHMSVHDRALSELITEKMATSPLAIRGCWLEVAGWGLGGSAEAERAGAWIDAREATYRADRIVILQILARQEGLELPDALARDLMTRSGEGAFHSAVEAFSVAGKLDASIVSGRINAISSILSGIGLKVSPVPGRMRELVGRVSELEQMLALWGQDTMADVGPTAVLCAGAAASNHELATVCLKSIDRQTTDLSAMVSNWPKGGKRLTAQVERLYWLLDGWEHLIDLWEQVVSRNALAEDVVPEISRLLPIVPPDEIDPNKENDILESQTVIIRGRHE